VSGKCGSKITIPGLFEGGSISTRALPSFCPGAVQGFPPIEFTVEPSRYPRIDILPGRITEAIHNSMDLQRILNTPLHLRFPSEIPETPLPLLES